MQLPNRLDLNNLLRALGVQGELGEVEAFAHVSKPSRALAAFYAASLFDERSEDVANLNRVLVNLEIAADELNEMALNLRQLKQDLLETGKQFELPR